MLDVVELLDGVLDLEQVVLIGLLVEGQLLLVLGRVVLGPFQVEGELGRGVAVARVQVGLDLGFEQGDVLAAARPPAASRARPARGTAPALRGPP